MASGVATLWLELVKTKSCQRTFTKINLKHGYSKKNSLNLFLYVLDEIHLSRYIVTGEFTHNAMYQRLIWQYFTFHMSCIFY